MILASPGSLSSGDGCKGQKPSVESRVSVGAAGCVLEGSGIENGVKAELMTQARAQHSFVPARVPTRDPEWRPDLPFLAPQI